MSTGRDSDAIFIPSIIIRFKCNVSRVSDLNEPKRLLINSSLCFQHIREQQAWILAADEEKHSKHLSVTEQSVQKCSDASQKSPTLTRHLGL